MYFNTNSSQNLIVTVTNPPATPRVVFPNPTFPNPPFDRTSGLSVRPDAVGRRDAAASRSGTSTSSASCSDSTALTVGYAGSRGRHLLRSNDVNTAAPITGSDGLPFFPAGAPRINTAWTTIELKSSDGDSWYRALIVEARRRWSNGFMFQSVVHVVEVGGHDAGVDVLLGRDQRHDVGVSRVHPRLQQGAVRLPRRAQLGGQLQLRPAVRPRSRPALSGALASGWRLSGIVNVRSGSPLTVFVQNNRSRSLWQPSLGPGIGRDRASYAPGFDADNAVTGDPNAWFNPAAFALSAGGHVRQHRPRRLHRPESPHRRSLAREGRDRSAPLGSGGRLEVRIEAFNIFNRANFGPPQLIAFAGAADGEAPLASFGRVRNTITSARQIQLGVRVQILSAHAAVGFRLSAFGSRRCQLAALSAINDPWDVIG